MSYGPPPAGGRVARPLGLLLVVPAFFALLGSYVVPGVRTFWTGFQESRLIGDGGGGFAGGKNYGRIAEQGFFGDLGYVLLIAVLPVLAACVLAPALAWLAHRGGAAGRLITRLGLVLPMVVVTPAGLALAWQARGELTGEPLQAQLLVGRVFWLTVFGLVVGVGVTVFLAALRRGDAAGGRPVRAVVSAGAALGLAVVAYTLQLWTWPFALTQGGPRNATNTPMLTVYSVSFRFADLGAGAAGGTVLGLLLGVLGLAAVAVLVLGRVRADVVAPRAGTRPTSALPLAGAVLLLVIALGVTGYGLWPWLSGLGAATPGLTGSAFNTWGPPLVSTGIGVTVAVLAGFGIGAMRPFGERSELLLFVFAPWLFVGTGPFSAVHFKTLADLDLLGTWPALIPPAYLSVPALVVFTLLFRGLAERRPGNLGGTLPPALPMAVAVGGVTYLVQAQDAFWQVLTVNNPAQLPTPAAALQLSGRGPRFAEGLSALPLPVAAVVLFALILAALQLFYLDRLSIRTSAPQPADVVPPRFAPPAGYPPAPGRPLGYPPPGVGYPHAPGHPPPFGQ